MKTKQEAIQEAYGDNWDEVKDFISHDGWTRKSLIPFMYVKDIDFTNRLQRPKSLRGIENNNGWVKIESKDDLPKNSGEYYVIDKFMETNPCREFFDNKAYISLNERWLHRYTHYQPIEKPKPPIY